MLQSNPGMRPSCEAIMSLDSFKMYTSGVSGVSKSIDVYADEGMIATIKMPRYLKNLNENLPASKYKR